VIRQCAILEPSRSGIYYKPVPVSAKDMKLMRQIDDIHLAFPFYGSRNIRHELWASGYACVWPQAARRHSAKWGKKCSALTL
jgi:hypothetical protein